MSSSDTPNATESITHQSGRSGAPDLRFIHYNDVYHIEAGSRDPVGGVARFQTVCNYYRSDPSFKDQPNLITLFSGDAFNPSLESSITKGSHMVPFLNSLHTNCACVGNHDLDFGITQFRHLANQCNFPWLIANVLDPALGEDVPLGNGQKTYLLEASNGMKIGLIGLVEREWLDTLNSVPPNIIYKSATATAKELVPGLRKQGADIIIAISHAREPNDNKLASNAPEGLIDMVLGGHDHFYQHSIINGTHVLRSGSDFKQLSYIKAWRRTDNRKKWDFDIIRRDIVQDLPEDPECKQMVEKITSAMKPKLEKPVGFISTSLDARFTTVRLKESNMGNFICDLMRLHYQADCAIMAAGTIRGDQVYPAGVFRLKDIMDCFPFEDPVVVLKIKGQAIWDALENGVSLHPALEGRFPQVSNIEFEFDAQAKPGSRIVFVNIAGTPLQMDKDYTVATRDYMTRGKDGYRSLLAESEGGVAEEVISEEHGLLISMILRQYFMSLKVVGRWKRWGNNLGRHWGSVQDHLHQTHPAKEAAEAQNDSSPEVTSAHTENKDKTIVDGHAIDSDSEDESHNLRKVSTRDSRRERELVIMRKFSKRWWRLSKLPGHPSLRDGTDADAAATWTKSVAPQIEGRIKETKHA